MNLLANTLAGLWMVTQASACELNCRVRFEENLGQTRREVRYLARGQAQTFFFTDDATHIQLDGRDGSASMVGLSFIGSNPRAAWEALERDRDGISYFIGNDPAKWVHNAGRFAKLARRGIYPGVDVAFYGDGRRLEYDLELAPGADPSVIRLSFDTAQKARAARDGTIEI